MTTWYSLSYKRNGEKIQLFNLKKTAVEEIILVQHYFNSTDFKVEEQLHHYCQLEIDLLKDNVFVA